MVLLGISLLKQDSKTSYLTILERSIIFLWFWRFDAVVEQVHHVTVVRYNNYFCLGSLFQPFHELLCASCDIFLGLSKFVFVVQRIRVFVDLTEIYIIKVFLVFCDAQSPVTRMQPSHLSQTLYRHPRYGSFQLGKTVRSSLHSSAQR